MRASTQPKFEPDEFLVSSQIASFWSNIKRKREKDRTSTREKRSASNEDEDEEQLQQNDEVWEVHDDEYLDAEEIFPDLEEELLDYFQQEGCLEDKAP